MSEPNRGSKINAGLKPRAEWLAGAIPAPTPDDPDRLSTDGCREPTTGGLEGGRERSITSGIARLGLDRREADVAAAAAFAAFCRCPDCDKAAQPEALRSAIGPTKVRITCPTCEITTDWIQP